MPALLGAGVTWHSLAGGSHGWGRRHPREPLPDLQGLLFLCYHPPPIPALHPHHGPSISFPPLEASQGPPATMKLLPNRSNCRNKRSPLSA